LPKPDSTKYGFIVMNTMLAFLVSVVGNKVADRMQLSISWLLIITVVTLVLCAVGLVEYEHYLHTRDLKQSVSLRSSSWLWNKASHRVSSLPARNKEMISIATLGIAMLIALSLISYHEGDIATDLRRDQIHNWIGLIGAHGSDFLFRKLGWLALLIPPILFTLSWWLFSSKSMSYGRSESKQI
jgi:hypothetical protein